MTYSLSRSQKQDHEVRAIPVDGGEGASMDLWHPAADLAGSVGWLLRAQSLQLISILPDDVECGVLDLDSIVRWVCAGIHLQVPAPEQDAAQWPPSAHALHPSIELTTFTMLYLLHQHGKPSPFGLCRHMPAGLSVRRERREEAALCTEILHAW